MSVLRDRLCSRLTSDILEKLRSSGITKTTELISRDLEDTCQLTGISYKDLSSIVQVLLAQCSAVPVAGDVLYDSTVETTAILSTGCQSIDSLLDGGLYTGQVTELAGDIAVGKTQLCFSTTAVTAAQNKQNVIYIDTGGVFSTHRILQLATVQSNEESDEFFSTVKLIVLDNVASVIYPILGGGTFSESQGQISLLGRKLKCLAADFSMAVLVTNNVVSSDKGGKSASLGRAWSHVPHVRVLIGHLNDDIEQTVRTAVVVKNSRGPVNVRGTFKITESGLVC